MEQKKTLWIIAGVGLFLLVILLAAMIFYKPASNRISVASNTVPVEKTSESNNGWTPDKKTEEVPLITETDTIPGTEEVPSEPAPDSLNVSDLFVVSENTTVYDLNQKPAEESNGSTTIDLNTLKSQLLSQQETDSKAQNINITVNVPDAEVKTTTAGSDTNVSVTAPVKKTQTAVEQEKSEKEASVKVTETASVPKTTASTKPAASTTPAKTSSSTAKTTSASTTTSSTAKTSSAVTRYWIQVASYSTKKAAEAARSKLEENKIIADIFTYQDSSEKVYYRVRVGPYTTKSEAEYWMNKIIQVKDFEKSGAYVTQTKN